MKYGSPASGRERECVNKQLLQRDNIFFGRLTPQIADKYFLSVLIHLCQLIFFTHMVFVKKIHTFLLSWESGKEKYLQGSLSVVSHPIVACSKTFSQWIELIWVSISQGYPIGVVVFRFEKPWSCDLVSWSQWSPTLPSPVLNTKTFMAALTLGHHVEYVRWYIGINTSRWLNYTRRNYKTEWPVRLEVWSLIRLDIYNLPLWWCFVISPTNRHAYKTWWSFPDT